MPDIPHLLHAPYGDVSQHLVLEVRLQPQGNTNYALGRMVMSRGLEQQAKVWLSLVTSMCISYYINEAFPFFPHKTGVLSIIYFQVLDRKATCHVLVFLSLRFFFPPWKQGNNTEFLYIIKIH